MERKKIFITRQISPTGIHLLKKFYNVIIHNSSESPSKNVFIKKVKDVDGILCTLSEKIDSSIMDAAGSNLKVINTFSTGFEHIDVDEATKRGIYVTNTGNILSDATADLTFSMILALSRKIIEGHSFILRKKWNNGWTPNLFLGKDVHGSTLGILGLGNIGSAVAERAKGFKMKVIYNNRHQLSKSIEKKLNVKFVTFKELLENSDFLSINLSYDKNNFHLIDSEQLKKMKKTSFLINTSRGTTINEASLIKALQHKWIAGAGLDVFENEPLSHESKLLQMKNVILLPHIGSATIQTRNKMSEVSAINIDNVLNNKMPLYLVNKKLRSFHHVNLD
jgi:glyoxylate reductase